MFVDRSAETEGEIWGLSEESAVASLWQERQNDTYKEGQCHSLAYPNLRRVSASVGKGWVLKYGVWRVDQGRGQLLAA